MSLVTSGVINALVLRGASPQIESIQARDLLPVGGRRVTVSRAVKFAEVLLSTTAGPLMLRNLLCWIEEGNQELELTVSRPVMQTLGYSTDTLLANARNVQPEWEIEGIVSKMETRADMEPSALQRISRVQLAARDPVVETQADDDVDRYESRTALPDMKLSALQAVIDQLEESQRLAATAGLSAPGQIKLRAILAVRADNFRLALGYDPPVKVAPLQVRLKPNAKPVKCQPRRYSPNDRLFLDRHTSTLEEAGVIYMNHRSVWCSAPRIVRKKEQDIDPNADPRMTVDTRAVNDQTEPMPWPMPVLEVVVGELEGYGFFFLLDWFRGYWQLPRHEDSQELYYFVTHRGVYTPRRVPMGVTDAVAYCQWVGEEIFGDLLGKGILAWLDHILGYAKTEDDLLVLLDKVLGRCEHFGLKLHAKKCRFFTKEAKWCGKLFSAVGVRHCPERVQGLVDMQAPMTAGDLQQFLCAVNWMRQGIPEYNRLTARLSAVLERAMAAAGSRKKAKLSKLLLADVGWCDEDVAALTSVRQALLKMVPLAHPRAKAEVCIYTDASHDYWGAVATQLEPEVLQLPLAEQNHRPLAFLSGRCVGAASRWPTIEKEAFAIVEATRRLEYLLMRPGGFHLYTDHRNLVYIFNPLGTDGAMARYQADKVQRWALSLMSFKYVIEHVPGEVNAWGDLLSRWGAGPSSRDARGAMRVSRLAVVDRVSPLEAPEFVWPTEAEIKRVQDAACSAGGLLANLTFNEERQVVVDPDGRLWIPDDAVELQQRLCVVTHAGASGHRGATTTAKSLSDLFVWTTRAQDVASFVNGCLHCMTTVTGKIPRPYGETLRATKPNELLHFDFLSMVEAVGGVKYVLVLKDGMSGFVELVACVAATSDQVYVGLMDWFKRFGVVSQWVSDQGPHFKNQVMERLQRALGAQHHFTTAYTPWANGTVEVVNREVLRCVKALASERKLLVTDWPSLLPVVQAALNGMPADRLGGVCPITAFTALPGGSQLSGILHPREAIEASLEWVDAELKKHIEGVRASLDGIHHELTSASEKRRRAARERHAKKKGVKLQRFSVGDYVLAATTTGTSGNKLSLIWRGPKRIVHAINDYTFEVQDLVAPFTVTLRHASRLQLYRDSQRGAVEDMIEQAIHGEGGHLVDALLACRLSPATHRWEVQVKWIGLDEIEASWEPAETIKHDVPVLFQKFVDAVPQDRARASMATALGLVAPPAPVVPRRLPRGRRPGRP